MSGLATPLRSFADARWARPCLAYNVQLDLTPAAVESMVQVQQTLGGCLPVPLHMSPASTLHVSVYAIAPHHWESPRKETYWREREDAFTHALLKVAAAHAPTTLCFTALRVLPRAVILVASDPSGLIADARAALRALADPDVPTPVYDLVHTTLARFAAAGSLSSEQVERACAQPVRIHAEVSALRVVRERVYPSLMLDDVARFPLLAGAPPQ